MYNWKTIECFDIKEPIWVLKYTLYHTPDGKWCKKDDIGAIAYTDCRGWYETEAEALKVLNHFPKPNTYKIEKVNKRKLLIDI
jgi:hypothetical protein